ncbi:MAG: nicotinate (nicotinamide) nucleotide adenylyltransferase [Terracidiphilus sp.]
MSQPARAARRVAFFGGSFDPPHRGHLAVARAAQAALGLDAVLFAPVGAQPLKPRGSTAAFAHRAAMTRLAIAGDPGFELSLADEPRPSGQPNYTIDTLLSLRAALPPSSTLFCLMGADSLSALRRWHRAAEIPFLAPLIVASRPSHFGWSPESLAAALPAGLLLEAPPQPEPAAPPAPAELDLWRAVVRNSAGDRAPLYLLPGLDVEISASQLRRRMRASRADQPPPEDLLTPAVAAYIRAHRLYR